MIIECPECGTKNQTDKPPEPGKTYRCGNCKEVITFLQTDDAPSQGASEPEKTSAYKHSSTIPKQSRGRKMKTHRKIALLLFAIVTVVLFCVLFIPSSSRDLWTIGGQLSGSIAGGIVVFIISDRIGVLMARGEGKRLAVMRVGGGILLIIGGVLLFTIIQALGNGGLLGTLLLAGCVVGGIAIMGKKR